MTADKRLDYELDRGPWTTMLLKADLAEERGETALAAGWRWLAAHERWPARHGMGGWFWLIESMTSESFLLSRDPHSLPSQLESFGEILGVRFDAPHQACTAAAVIVGAWLEQQDKTPQSTSSDAHAT